MVDNNRSSTLNLGNLANTQVDNARFQPMLDIGNIDGHVVVLGETGNAPGRTSSLGEKFKAYVSGKIDGLKESIKEGIASFKSNVAEFKTQFAADRMVKNITSKSGYGGNYTYTSLEKGIETARQNGPSGIRAFAHLFIQRNSEELNIANKKDAPPLKLALDKTNKEDAKVLFKLEGELIAFALKSDPEASAEGAKNFLTDLKSMLDSAGPEGKSIALRTMKQIVDSALATVSDTKSLYKFAQDVAASPDSKLGNTKETFLRANTGHTKIVMSVGVESIRDAKQEVQDIVKNILSENTWDASVLADDSIKDVDKDPKNAEAREEIAESRVLLANKVFDAVFGDDGSKIADRLGNDAIEHLQELGKSLLAKELEDGKSPEEANRTVKTFYQNVIFLRGHCGQIAIGSEDRTKESLELQNQSSQIAKVFQSIANEQVKPSKLCPELIQAYNNSGIAEKIDTVYSKLGMPQLDAEGKLIKPEVQESVESFAEGIGRVLGELGVNQGVGVENKSVEELLAPVSHILSQIDNDLDLTVDSHPDPLAKEIHEASTEAEKFLEGIFHEPKTETNEQVRTSVSRNSGVTKEEVIVLPPEEQIQELEMQIVAVRQDAVNNNGGILTNEQRNLIRNFERAILDLQNE